MSKKQAVYGGEFRRGKITPPQVVSLIVKDVKCPTCGCGEMHPTLKDRVLIRGFKVYSQGHWWSQCLVCSGYYDSALNETPSNWDRKKGWFK